MLTTSSYNSARLLKRSQCSFSKHVVMFLVLEIILAAEFIAE